MQEMWKTCLNVNNVDKIMWIVRFGNNFWMWKKCNVDNVNRNITRINMSKILEI